MKTVDVERTHHSFFFHAFWLIAKQKKLKAYYLANEAISEVNITKSKIDLLQIDYLQMLTANSPPQRTIFNTGILSSFSFVPLC